MEFYINTNIISPFLTFYRASSFHRTLHTPGNYQGLVPRRKKSSELLENPLKTKKTHNRENDLILTGLILNVKFNIIHDLEHLTRKVYRDFIFSTYERVI